MDKIIKIILAILLLGCLLDMPYGYYQLVRFCGMIGFGFLAYQSSQAQQRTQMLLYGALALLFQPFFKIALGRGLWNIIDVIVAIVLIISLFKRNR